MRHLISSLQCLPLPRLCCPNPSLPYFILLPNSSPISPCVLVSRHPYSYHYHALPNPPFPKPTVPSSISPLPILINHSFRISPHYNLFITHPSPVSPELTPPNLGTHHPLPLQPLQLLLLIITFLRLLTLTIFFPSPSQLLLS